jgi:hypothetical protein
MRRTSRQAGSAITRAAITSAASTENPAQAAVWAVVAPKLAEPNAVAPMTIAAPRPIAAPMTPTSSDSASARRTRIACAAPRARRSA